MLAHNGPRRRTIWDEIDERMAVLARYEEFSERWRWIPARLRRFLFKLKEERHGAR